MSTEQEIAVSALEVAKVLLSTFTEKGSIGAIDNVLRSTWQNRGKIESLGATVDRLSAELEAAAGPVQRETLRPLKPVWVVARTLAHAERMVAQAQSEGVIIDAWRMFSPEKTRGLEEPFVLIENGFELDDEARDMLITRRARMRSVMLEQ